MTTLERLRAQLEHMPPGSLVPAAWLREQLGIAEKDATGADLTVAQLAARFGRKTNAVRAWIEAGRFPGAYKFMGREWRVPPAGVAAFEESERGRPPRAHATKRRGIGDWRNVAAQTGDR